MFRCYLVVLVSIVFFHIPAFAANELDLGKVHLAVKIDYIQFVDDINEDVGIDEDVYYGVEAYYGLSDNLYLGSEVGYSNPEGDFSYWGDHYNTEVTFMPLELNIKYSRFINSDIYFDIGTGFAYIYIEEKINGFRYSSEEDDWLLGGQVFLGLNYKLHNLFVGVNGKYQVTEEFQDDSNDYENWRIGGQIGMIF